MTDFQKTLTKLFPYVFVMLVSVYMTGLAPTLWGNSAYTFSNFMIIIGLAVIFGLENFIYGIKNGFTWYFFPLGAFCFLPTIFIFYRGDPDFYVNLLVYFVISLIFHLTGAAVYRRREYIRSAMNPLPDSDKEKK